MGRFRTTYQEFIRVRTYARWNADLKRRETWSETVSRYKTYLSSHFRPRFDGIIQSACDAVESLYVMPSMRLLWTAGLAHEQDHVAGYNCAYTVIEKVKDFADILYILMNGAGVGFSVERQFINKLPEVPADLVADDLAADDPIIVQDTKYGWALAFYECLVSLYAGEIPTVDYSMVRPKGAPLKTFGGRASGPEPLKQLFTFTVSTFRAAQGRKLNSLEVFDIVCMVANCVVSGGVRRSATVCLTNLSDERMRNAKTGDWWKTHPWRALANISVAHTEKPEADRFLEEWLALVRSGSGERGIVNREGFMQQHPRLSNYCGINPCGEIALESKQFCNLTEVVVRPWDTLETLKTKVRYATFLGTLQSTFTNFRFIDDEWRRNTERDRLLGVSLTGTSDHPILSQVGITARTWLSTLRKEAYETNRHFAEELGITPAAAITCVKPSGTVSQLVNTSSGLHARYAPYYLRRVRITRTDPLFKYMVAMGMSWEPEVGQTRDDCTTAVFTFPIKSPDASVVRTERNAIQQLDYWKQYKREWCHHNPSVTITVKPDEWVEVGAWVYKNWDVIGGLSFMPDEGVTMPLAPYEECTEKEWAERVAAMPPLDFEGDALAIFEGSDHTTGSQELACQGGTCEL